MTERMRQRLVAAERAAEAADGGGLLAIHSEEELTTLLVRLGRRSDSEGLEAAKAELRSDGELRRAWREAGFAWPALVLSADDLRL